MKFLRREYDTPWLCARHFNELVFTSEKFGGNDMEERMMDGFREVVDYSRFLHIWVCRASTHMG
jgi:hypothetical protein